jgi:hypothetical protein
MPSRNRNSHSLFDPTGAEEPEAEVEMVGRDYLSAKMAEFVDFSALAISDCRARGTL